MLDPKALKRIYLCDLKRMNYYHTSSVKHNINLLEDLNPHLHFLNIYNSLKARRRCSLTVMWTQFLEKCVWVNARKKNWEDLYTPNNKKGITEMNLSDRFLCMAKYDWYY